MYITKTIETTIDLFDSNDIYSADIDSVILNKLNARYKNVCYMGVLIQSVDSIVRRSCIRMVDDRIDGSAYVDVEFIVTCIILVHGEILHNCRINEIKAYSIFAEHKIAIVKLQKESQDLISKILKIDQRIPFVVKQVRYTISENKISVVATPFIPTVIESPYYVITDGLSEMEIEKLNILVSACNAEELLHVDITKKDQHGKIASDLELQPVKLDLQLLSTIDEGIIHYPCEDERSNKRLFWNKKNKMSQDLPIQQISSRLYPVIAEIYNKYLLYLLALRGFVETYNTPESMLDLVTYWKICKGAKV